MIASSEQNGEPAFKSGFVAILGRPNAGKSTLLNYLIGQKLAIISPKPQTTRNAILGILTRDRFQIVFVDTPGIIEPKNLLNTSLIDAASRATEDVDLVYHITDVTDTRPETQAVQKLLELSRAPCFLLVNKIDRLKRNFDPASYPHLPDPSNYKEVFGISALKGDNIDYLLQRTLQHLKPGPLYYDPEQVSDRDLRFFTAEIIREKAFELLGQELPYAVAVQVLEFEERKQGKFYIRAVIYVEQESQKGMIIGAGGGMLKKIGSLARPDIEILVDHPVYLELWVKVRKNWTKKEHELRNFGYFPKKKKG